MEKLILISCFLFSINSLLGQDQFFSLNMQPVEGDLSPENLEKHSIEFELDRREEVLSFFKQNKIPFKQMEKRIALQVGDVLSWRPARLKGQKELLSSTYLIDYKHPEIEKLFKVISKKKKLGVNQIIEDVWVHISHKKSYRQLDPASFTAKHRTGDTSEHATLACALMRRKGIPCQLILGLSIVSRGPKFFAMGRFNVLAELKNKTQIFSPFAPMDQVEGGEIFFLPLMLIEDESIQGIKKYFGMIKSIPHSVTFQNE